jgi:methionine synthase I (cobalamin-dependent)
MTERHIDSPYLQALQRRVLVYDGAMGTNIQRYNLSAEDLVERRWRAVTTISY